MRPGPGGAVEGLAVLVLELDVARELCERAAVILAELARGVGEEGVCGLLLLFALGLLTSMRRGVRADM